MISFGLALAAMVAPFFILLFPTGRKKKVETSYVTPTQRSIVGRATTGSAGNINDYDPNYQPVVKSWAEEKLEREYKEREEQEQRDRYDLEDRERTQDAEDCRERAEQNYIAQQEADRESRREQEDRDEYNRQIRGY